MGSNHKRSHPATALVQQPKLLNKQLVHKQYKTPPRPPKEVARAPTESEHQVWNDQGLNVCGDEPYQKVE